jgi:transcriptional regulator with XRE-family HTH domain
MVKLLASSKSLFGRRLREARLRAGIAQDKLGVMIGLDEGCSSARISRYESGVHEPSLLIGQLLAKVLHLPTAYFYTEDDSLAELISIYEKLKVSERKVLLKTAESLLNKPMIRQRK